MNVFLPLFTLIPFGSANTLVLSAYRCPDSAFQWENRGDQFQCDVTKNITYHCILNSYGELIEACIKKEVIRREKAGCPWIFQRKGRLLFGSPLSKCQSSITGCPEENHGGYTTDSLYLYPKCLVPQNLRNNTVAPTQSSTQMTQKYTNVMTADIVTVLQRNGIEECTCIVYIVCMTISTVFMVLLLVGLLLKAYINRRMNRKEYSFWKEENRTDVTSSLVEVKENKREYSSSIETLKDNDIEEQLQNKGPFIENKASKWLRQRLKELQDKEIRPIFLHGISGSGKSTVALHCLGKDCFIVKASSKRYLMKSLKDLATSMSIRLSFETNLIDIIMDISKQLHYIKLLIDDVPDRDTMKLVYPLLQKVQCVVTTTNENLVYDIDSSDHLEVKGLSVKEASDLFKEKNLSVDHDNKDFKQLISILEGSPLGILSVIKHMKEMKVTVNRVLQYIKQHEEHLYTDNEGGKLFNSLEYVLRYITSEHPEITGLIMALQFLSTENIPICLLYALAAYEANGRLPVKSDIDFDKAESVVNTFISACQKVSFGQVTGVDDERKISVSTVVQITVKKSSQQPEDRRQLLLKLLKCMSWLFVKDHIDKNEHRRCINLLPHAIEVMHHFPLQGSETTVEESLVFIQVCDQVRFTYEVLGHELKEKQYAECLMKHVLENVLCVEKDYFILKFQNETENMETIAEEIRHKFRKFAQNDEATISKLAVDYIKNKVKSDNEQETLRSKTGDGRLFTSCRLTGNGRKCLEAKHLLVKEPPLLARIFVYEIMITALRSFGRFTLVHEKEDKTFRSFVLLIKTIANLESEKEVLQNYKSIQSVEVEFMEIEAACTLSETSNLTSLIEQSEKLLTDDSKYFKYGLFVHYPKDNLNHILRCKCVMLQCYRRLQQPKELDESAKSIKDSFDKDRATYMKASYSQKAKQTLVDFYMEKEKHKEAIDFLRKYEHVTTSEVTCKNDCMDILLQCQCYQKLKMFDERSNYLHRFEFKVPTEEIYAKEIIEKIKETEQPM